MRPPADPAITRIVRSGNWWNGWSGLRLWIRSSEETLNEPSDSTEITTNPDAGEALQKVGLGIQGRPGDPERDLRVTLFWCRGEFVSKQATESAGEFLVEEET